MNFQNDQQDLMGMFGIFMFKHGIHTFHMSGPPGLNLSSNNNILLFLNVSIQGESIVYTTENSDGWDM